MCFSFILTPHHTLSFFCLSTLLPWKKPFLANEPSLTIYMVYFFPLETASVMWNFPLKCESSWVRNTRPSISIPPPPPPLHSLPHFLLTASLLNHILHFTHTYSALQTLVFVASLNMQLCNVGCLWFITVCLRYPSCFQMILWVFTQFYMWTRKKSAASHSFTYEIPSYSLFLLCVIIRIWYCFAICLMKKTLFILNKKPHCKNSII